MTTPNKEIRTARPGDVVEIDLALVPVNFVPEPLFDVGRISFVLGYGNYLPAIHELVEGCAVGSVVENEMIDAGWGARKEDLILEHIELASLLQFSKKAVEVGQTIRLRDGINVLVTAIENGHATIDANHPMAGASYKCSFTVLSIKSVSQFHQATFALGCFWGAELAFLRLPGVVGTQVGYTQGSTSNPTYDQVCMGTTRHREAVLVIYDSSVVTYKDLLRLALERLAATSSPSDLSRLFASPDDEEDDSSSFQYRHGFYYHTQEQREDTQEVLSSDNRFGVEVLPAAPFYAAEEYHQKYLYKGGQSARKNAKEEIRCFG